MNWVEIKLSFAKFLQVINLLSFPQDYRGQRNGANSYSVFIREDESNAPIERFLAELV